MKVEGMTLANVIDGELEEQFQHCLLKVVEYFAEAEWYEHTGEAEILTVKMPIEIALHREAGSGIVSVSARAGVKEPKRKTVTRAAFVKSGAVLVMPEIEAPLFDNVRKIKTKEETP
ncbi:MAG: hypothetical protein A3E78_11860 [Alphaproteobacteria bacterium RIFCSPHIGHO2_12_FULL_63_12]|nr:MAG: hypothetical protein A3E78_11860 [Alphaproteobacteria bacterium RIFCSPHIGHO2_12_FULL_63_12]